MSPSIPQIELSTLQAQFSARPIVYFCAEFAVDEHLPIYAGGLGVLAGDVIAQAAQDNKSFVGVGMLYHNGYLHQSISKNTHVLQADEVDIQAAELQLLSENGVAITISVPIHARTVLVKCWVKMVGNVPLLLLDTDVEGNEAQDIALCDQLYHGDREHRFKQEFILGVGGLRMVTRLGITPRLIHLNEGHSSLLFFELAKQYCSSHSDTEVTTFLGKVPNVVFTNHTLVPAGNDVFSKDLVISYLSSYALEFPIDPAVLVNLGLIQDSSLFSPTMLALRLATVSQGVSKLHVKKALELWPDHPMVAVTNGVRQSYWQAQEIASSLHGDDASLWQAHLERKKILCTLIREATGTTWSEDDLLIGWSRRLASYKRPLLLFEDEARLKKLLQNSGVPVRVLLAGKPHSSDTEGIESLQKIMDLIGKFDASIVYLQNYDLHIAKQILSGVDVLLNTPVRGFEASGTSGMKACLNGVLQCTTLDGWTDEVNWEGVGWVIPELQSGAHLYELLEKEVIPTYHQAPSDGVWIKRMRASIDLATHHYTTIRMLEELETSVYATLHTESTS